MSYNMTTIREIIGAVLCEAGTKYPDLYVIDSDLAKSTTTNKFKEQFPDRFVETGIAEQNAVSIATGIADEGKIPFYVNFAMFVSGTAWTQVRQACYAKANIKLIATHPGMDGGYDGATHHANEDLALMRALPNMRVLVPSNQDEFKQCVKLAIEMDGPVYIRAARDVVPDVPTTIQGSIGSSYTIKDDGEDFAIVYEGSSTALAFASYDACVEKGYHGKLVNAFSLKPFDTEMIVSLAKSVKGIVTIENHSTIGGLGSAVADVLATMPEHAPLHKIAVEDVFTESGPSKEIKEKYGLTLEHVLHEVEKIMKN